MSFIKALNAIEYGAFTSQVSEEMSDLISAIKTYGGKGSLTLKLDIEASKDLAGVVTIKPSLSTKAPAPQRRQLLYIGDDGKSLQIRDPKQPELEGLKDADEINGVKDVDEEEPAKDVG